MLYKLNTYTGIIYGMRTEGRLFGKEDISVSRELERRGSGISMSKEQAMLERTCHHKNASVCTMIMH